MQQIILPALVALLCTSWIFPYILKVAKVKNIVDNPDARKLQRVPVPVLGGLTVVFGILTGVMSFNLFGNFYDLFPIFSGIIIILIVGLVDDMISLSPKIRFVIEIILVLYLIMTTGIRICDFHGLWGLDAVPAYVSVPLTVFASVGIINAVNLIDGVDGYSSGYSIVSSSLFGVMFHHLGNERMVTLSAIVAASLLPFFLHNVFGKTSKMFIGDAGTLSLGVVFSMFVTTCLCATPGTVGVPEGMGLVAFTLAVLCVPVFDTLRVMSARILRGKSPFSPDKTHLHHLFIELGYSHIGAALSIIGMNLTVVLCWYAAYRLGLSVDMQLYVVIVLGGLSTFVFYPFCKAQLRKDTALASMLKRVGEMTHVERTGFWRLARKWADRSSEKEEAAAVMAQAAEPALPSDVYMRQIAKAQEFLNENRNADLSRVKCLLHKMLPREYYDAIESLQEHQDPKIILQINGGNNAVGVTVGDEQ